MPRWLKYALLILTLLLIGGIPLAMQHETGFIQGVITENHAAIAKASVEARNVMTGEVTRAESNAEGHYTLGGLRAGRYSLWVQAEGHNSVWIREVIVEHGQVTHKDVDLARITTLTSGL
jgi:hypothetical protein